MAQSGPLVCAATGAEVDTGWTYAKSFFGAMGRFMLRGSGEWRMPSFGAIHAVGAQGCSIVDTGHIVAFDDSLTYKIRPVAGFKQPVLVL